MQQNDLPQRPSRPILAPMPRRPHLPAPFLQRISLREPLASRDDPFNLPWLQDPDFELTFQSPVTILVGENGSGKSTLVEALAALSGHDEAGGGKGYRPLDHPSSSTTPGRWTKAAPPWPMPSAPPGRPRSRKAGSSAPKPSSPSPAMSMRPPLTPARSPPTSSPTATARASPASSPSAGPSKASISSTSPKAPSPPAASSTSCASWPKSRRMPAPRSSWRPIPPC